MSTRRPRYAYPLPQGQSRVGSGAALLDGIDGRSVGARRYKEVLSLLSAEVTRMARPMTHTEELLARRAAAIAIQLETLEAKQAKGEAVDVGDFSAATNTLRRLMQDLNLVDRS